MSKVVELDAYKKIWIHGECHCVSCGFRWYGVMTVMNVNELECPECHKMTGGLYK